MGFLVIGLNYIYFFLFDSVEGSAEEGMQARPVYVAAVDLSCTFEILLTFSFLLSEFFMNA